MPYYQRTMQFGFGGSLTPVVKKLLIANGAVFVLQFLLPGNILIKYFALFPNQVITQFALWQLVTYMFLHGNLWHIFFNMFTLFMFGREVEHYFGSKKFTQFYALAGISGGICHILFNWGASIPVVGASAAIYGVLVAFAVLFPHRVITLLLFFILPIQLKARTLVFIFVGLSLFMGLQSQLYGTLENVAHLAHLGGALAGYLYLKHRYLFGSAVKKVTEFQRQQQEKQRLKREAELKERKQEIDRILDHINDVGYENISDEEKDILKKASDYLSKNDK